LRADGSGVIIRFAHVPDRAHLTGDLERGGGVRAPWSPHVSDLRTLGPALGQNRKPMDRKVTATKTDRNGNITALCNAGQSWDIHSGKKSYYVQQQPRRNYVRAVAGELQTTADATDKNHLAQLPTI
jgi:hypothetical protein